MKNNHNFSVVNQNLIDYQPLFNKAVKSIEFPVASDEGFINQIESVIFICNHEGTILYADKDFIKNKPLFECLNGKTILDFIHPEDVSIVIEYLVQLIQERTDSFIIEARFLLSENQFFITKWHVGYLRGLFYLYPISIPGSNSTQKESISKFTKTKPSTSAQKLWKIEVSKTLFEMDRMILKHLKSCTTI
jgi:hypothetical protein